MNAKPNSKYRNHTLKLIVFTTVLRCFLASKIEFGNDEVYYWTYALHLQASYFDHPPLIAFFIRFFTLNLNFNNELLVRLAAIIGSTINTWMIYKILTAIKNEQAGWFASLLYSGSVYTSIISGFFILPDSPQVVFWLASVFLLIKIFILKENQNRNFLLFGLYVGMATMCKVHGIYLWFATGIFILFFEREQLKNRYFYAGCLITLIIIFPVLFWNYQNAFITYQYQGKRILINSGINIPSFLREVTGEILYCNPIIFLLIFLTLLKTIKGRFYINKLLFWLLICLSLPLIFTVWVISLFRNTLPHWCGPAYLSLLILTAFYADACFKESSFKAFLRNANLLLLAIVILAYLTINYLPENLGKKSAEKLGAGDFTMDLYGWNSFESAFIQLKDKDVHAHKMQADAIIISNKWFPAAHLTYYVAQPLNMKLYAFGPLFDIHNFAWQNRQNGLIKKGADAYYISPSNYNSIPDSSYKQYFTVIEQPVVIHQYRNKIPVRNFYVYRMKGFK